MYINKLRATLTRPLYQDFVVVSDGIEKKKYNLQYYNMCAPNVAYENEVYIVVLVYNLS